ncbi:MAG: hypothetical protein DI535_17775 [Citrobacter freundii]|nr:MAG: hypothetical protein DI535_17775 [Citrobacter freundii]
MTPSTLFNNCTSYPGWYSPSAEVSNILHDLDHFHMEKYPRLRVRLSEFEHHYKVVVPLTGTLKEDIVVYTHDDQLMIALKKKHSAKLSKSGHTPVDRYLFNVVSLPQDADAEFSSAELKQENLEICLSRMEHKRPCGDHQIIVY